ncbi:hypothetical protein WJX73_005738 [Symbiochloris irregularis]|uniref:MICOS complex subunit MIC13 n=1 Tax=Symbiochloris irregularis TaxID=706552 RepID=A0AAW1NW98_9CHLO
MSLVRKQKVLSFCVGIAGAGAAYVSTQKLIWQHAADLADHSRGSPPPGGIKTKHTLVDEHYREQAIRQWNQAVDKTFRPVVEALSKRNL